MSQFPNLQQLTEVNLDDLVEATGVGKHTLPGRWLRILGRSAAATFAQTALRMDAMIGTHGMRAGASWGLRAFHTALEVEGAACFPQQGPVLVLANHPGMGDVLALLAAIPRDDVRIIAARRPFLELLTNLQRSLIWVDPIATDSLAPLRAATDHLRAGGVLLTFPAGKIEPDPGLLATDNHIQRRAALYAQIIRSLRAWNRSGDLLARSSPHLQVVGALVSGVISPAAAHSPLRKLRRTPAGRDHLSAMLQISVPTLRDVTATVRLAPPLPVAALATQHKRRASVTRAAVEIMATMLNAPACQDSVTSVQ